jgi:predicted signal transduction protein with EAL and GGDEF domain
MGSARSVTLKCLTVAGLLVAIGLVLFLSGIGVPAILLIVSCIAALLWWFIRRPRPQGELPCASVSCCHYLGDQEEDRPQQPQ